MGKEGGDWEEERVREEQGGDTNLGYYVTKFWTKLWNKFCSTVEPTDLLHVAYLVPFT